MILPLVVQHKVTLPISYQTLTLLQFWRLSPEGRSIWKSRKRPACQMWGRNEIVCGVKASFLVKENQWDARELPRQPMPVTCEMTTFQNDYWSHRMVRVAIEPSHWTITNAHKSESQHRIFQWPVSKITRRSVQNFSCVWRYWKTVGALSVFNWIDGNVTMALHFI